MSLSGKEQLMNGAQLARALSNVASQRPELDKSLRDHLAKWVKSTLVKGVPSLEGLRRIQSAAGDEFVEWHLTNLTENDLVKWAKKMDPHLEGIQQSGAATLRSHLSALIGSRIELSQKMPKPTIDQVFELSDSFQRRRELEKQSAATLKAAIRRHGMNVGALSRKPSKVELIEHIQASIDSGWPAPRSVLDNSKY